MSPIKRLLLGRMGSGGGGATKSKKQKVEDEAKEKEDIIIPNDDEDEDENYDDDDEDKDEEYVDAKGGNSDTGLADSKPLEMDDEGEKSEVADVEVQENQQSKAEDDNDEDGNQESDDKQETAEEKDHKPSIKNDDEPSRKNDSPAAEENDTTAATEVTTPPRRQQRSRRNVTHYSPEMDLARQASARNVGRGLCLSEVVATRESVLLHEEDPDAILLLHRFMLRVRYRGRTKIPVSDCIQEILDFSGYLPIHDESLTDAQKEQIDRSIEKKFSIRAYQHTMPELKRMCAVLFLEVKGLSKDAVIEKLLDFLGCPKKRPGRPPLHRRLGNTDYDDLPGITGSTPGDANNEDINMPTDHQLRQWTRAYVRCFNLKKVTVRNALETASDKFGVDLSSKHTRIKELLVEEM